MRRHWPLNHEHFDALVGKVNRNVTRLEDEHERDFADLWNFLCEVAEAPDSVALRLVLREVRQLRLEVAELDERVTQVVRTLHHHTGEVSKATGEFLGD